MPKQNTTPLSTKTRPPQIDEYLRYIAKSVKVAMPVKDIYLFGSYADGTFREERSDLDIYIVTPDKSKRQIDWIRVAQSSFNRLIRMPIDLLVGYEDDFNTRSKWFGSLEYDIMETGVNINEL